MSDDLSRLTRLSPVQAATLRHRLASQRERPCEPIAVVGLGCRFPGADGPQAYWDLLSNGIDAVGPVPPERWDADALYDPDPNRPGHATTRQGAFIGDANTFDYNFFGISRREADRMDPQQRVLLQVTWAALEHAGIVPATLRGSRTGVFVGASSSDYRVQALLDLDAVDMYAGTGNAHAILANRLSYLLDLRGPSLALDTACSSSLVAAHLAARALTSGECDRALVAGVHLALLPHMTVSFSRARMLSPDGRCHTFDADANGYGRGEGCGVVVLRRLVDALADGDRVLAVLRGTATNQDGRSNGLTAPNGRAQEAVIRDALADARVSPDAVGMIEAHGTGTPLGDPIEVSALARVFGDGSHALAVSSVKTQIGHLEPAAGIAGLIKVVLALRHGVIPPNLHLRTLNPLLPLADTRLHFPTEATPWPTIDGRRVAGVSGFGFGGTNAHAVLEQVPDLPTAAPAPGPHLLVLSGRTDEAVAEAATAWARALDDVSVGEAAHTAAVRRTHFSESRLAVVADDRAEARAALDAFAAGGSHPALVPHPGTGRVAFAFTGQGAQWPGMGRELAERYPVFRDALARCVALQPELEPMLLGGDDAIHRTEHAQPALFAWAWAMTDLLGSWGIRPDALVGHSLGELVAATVAGCLSLEDGLGLAAIRGRLMQEQRGDGAMAALRCTEAETHALLARYPGVVLAAVNGPRSTTVSGDADAVGALVAELSARGVGARTLTVSHAFHSHHMDPAVAPFRAAVSEVALRPPSVPLVANLGGGLADDTVTTPEYWAAHVRGTVRFADGVRCLLDEPTLFVEIGPKVQLTPMGRATGGTWLPTTPDRLLHTLGALHLAGAPVDWAQLYDPHSRVVADLPTYPFARTRCGLTPSAAPSPGPTATPVSGTFLGERLRLPGLSQAVFQTAHSASQPGWIGHHRLFDRVLSPAASHVGLALAGLCTLGLRRDLVDLSFPHALRLTDGEAATLHLVIDDDGDSLKLVRLGDEDVVHATGRLAEAEPGSIGRVHDAPDHRDGGAFYDAWGRAGYQLGASFQWIREAWRAPGRARVRLTAPDGLLGADDGPLHPGLIDSCFQAITLCLDDGDVDRSLDGSSLFVPVAIERVSLGPAPADGPLTAHVHLRRSTARQQVADLLVEDATGQTVVAITGFTARRVPRALLLGTPDHEPVDTYAVTWREEGPPTGGSGSRPLVVATAHAAQVLPADLEARVLPEDPSAACAALATWAVDAPRLVLFTRGAAAVDGDPPTDRDGAALWGFRRGIEAELPGRVRVVDLDPTLAPVADVVAAELAADAPETAWRAGRRLVPRLVPAPSEPWSARALERGTGGIDGLALRALDAEAPGPGEVEITVLASCLNFRDVLGTLGVYPGDPGPLGGECCGIVRRLGAGVDHLDVGQRVTAALARTGTMRTYAIADARFVAPVPEGLSDLDAATAPIAYATASYGLEQLAELAAGERVLVHAASGGVGMAAVHLALARGCEVVGTAGSPEKRALLSAMGLAMVCDSRSTTYQVEITERWGDRPIDVVLNSLGTEHVSASLALVAPGGRFVEIGKADVLDEERAAALDRIGYVAFDLAALSLSDPDRVGELLQSVARRQAAGELPPLPRRAAPADHAKDVFRGMARAHHVGRLVLTWPDAPQPWVKPGERYLVTGGLGALGLHSARWLVDSGATDVVLLGRSAPSADALSAIGALRERARVDVAAADVTDVGALHALGSVHGVVHAAGVLDDALLDDITEASLARVLHPKVHGARALRQAHPDAWMLLYSSAVGTVGAVGQAAYAAANAWLDHAAIGWTATGARVRSLGWGPWDRGMAAHTDDGARTRWGAMGIAPVTETSGADALTASVNGPAHGVYLSFDARRAHPMAAARAPAIVSEMLDAMPDVPVEDAPSDLLGFLQATLRSVLDLPPDAPVDPHRPLPDLGVDSLMGAELVARVQGRLGRTIQAADLVDHPTLASLAAWLDGSDRTAEDVTPAPVVESDFEVLEF